MRTTLPAAAFLLAVLAGGTGCATTSRHSGSYDARKSMVRESVRRGDWSTAFPAVNELHREDPRDPEVLALRGVVYREQKLLPEAEADLKQSLEIDDGSAYAHASIAVLYERIGQAQQALDHHRRATELEPTSAAYLNNLGFALLAHGNPKEATVAFREALRLDPTSARTRNNLGFAYARAGDFVRASEQFALAGTPAEAKNNLGYAYESTGNLAQAYEAYAEALRLDPALARARKNLAEVSRRLGRPVPNDVAQDPASSKEG
mgnify:CR=1 FL=1